MVDPFYVYAACLANIANGLCEAARFLFSFEWYGGALD